MSHELPKAYEPGAIETRWAEYWIREKLFHVETPNGTAPEINGSDALETDGGRGRPPHTSATRPVFTLLLPPPNVTGRLHMGHMLNQTQMDILVRWHRMRGFITLWLPGTDHAGIATQMMVDRQLRSEGKSRIEMGREKFVERVWEWKRHYGGAILEQMKRLGVSVDWGREYFTMDENLSRAVREVFVRLHEEGLIYRGKYIVNWCADCGTAISDLEVKHEDVPGKLYEIRYPVVGTTPGTDEFITVATTRPETMLGDTAVAVNPKDERYTHLHGKKVLLPLMNREIPIITDELAQPEFGTGAVKVTPAHDPNDFEAGKRHALPQIEVIDEHNTMSATAGAYAGLDRFAARVRIVADLTEQGFLVGTKDYTIALGKCDRSDTIVEPRLSEQWFVKIGPLAKKAIEAVESGEIRITPDNYRQIYLNWMSNIHDWCVSRQLWWGHRIPAWTCEGCKEVLVAREAPVACSKCGRAKLEQVTDVLDTWFSSGLLPFTTLGWPEKTRDQEVFYPTTLLITAYEILFFWVARMIMFGCHFMEGHKQDPAIKKASGWADKKNDSVPFREVYIHALVRDAERQKMSKTKGNVIDPLEIIDRFGTDATRFTLAAMAAPGTDIAFNESRTEGYRAFANKIWNAARFMFMNLDRIEQAKMWSLEKFLASRNSAQSDSVSGFQPVTLEDRWILSRFTEAALEVNISFRGYKFHEAANRIYDFFWGDFCDWYLELIKSRLSLDVDPRTVGIACANLVSLFEASLRLLHPIMPFITEEIWHAIYDGKPPQQSIALAQYPLSRKADQISVVFGPIKPDSGSVNVVLAQARVTPVDVYQDVDQNALLEMAILQDLIVNVRNLRAELKVEPKVKVPIEVFAHQPEIRTMIEENRGAIERLANVERVTLVDGSLAKLPAVRATARFDVRLVYEKRVDPEVERERVKAEHYRLIAEKERLQKQLDNEGFLLKAPAKVVEGAKKRLDELGTLITKHRGILLDQLGTTDAKIHHYIPQFYLEAFLDPTQVAKGQNLLWVYEAGKTPRLSPTGKAASEVHFYSFEDAGEIKKTTEAVLSKLESHTAPVLRRIIAKQFRLSDLERSEFAGFVALTFCRTPFFLRSIDEMAADFQRHFSKTMASTPGVLERALRVVELVEQNKTDVTADKLREFVLSDRYTVKQQSKAWTLKMMFEMMLDLLPIIERMRWSWLVSDDEAFVTSDEPIAIFDRKATSLYRPGFMSSDSAEFTFPLSRNVCLYCTWRGTAGVAKINAHSVRQINRRTISWATRYVYASERSEGLAGLVNDLLGTRGE